jgi:hypothetical protein
MPSSSAWCCGSSPKRNMGPSRGTAKAPPSVGGLGAAADAAAAAQATEVSKKGNTSPLGQPQLLGNTSHPGDRAPLEVLKACFAEHAQGFKVNRSPSGIAVTLSKTRSEMLKLNLARFKACCLQLGLEHEEEDVERIFEKCALNGVMYLDGFVKGVTRGSFLMHVVVGPTAIPSYKIPASFDWMKSTSENYNTGKAGQFVGEFAHIRKGMDYSYHPNYPTERQLWQDEVIKSVVVKTKPQSQPWIVYTCGPMGAGKGFALSWMSSKGYFPLESIVHIDPDHFKEVMTEWDGFVEKSKTNEAVQPGTLCHRESGFIQVPPL